MAVSQDAGSWPPGWPAHEPASWEIFLVALKWNNCFFLIYWLLYDDKCVFSLCFFCHLQIFKSCEWFTLYLWTQHVFFCEKLRCLAILYVFYCLGTPTQSLGGFHGGHMAARWMRGCWKVKQGFCRWYLQHLLGTLRECLCGPIRVLKSCGPVDPRGLETMGIQIVYLFTCVCFCGWCFLTDFTWITIKNPPSREYTGFFPNKHI